MARINTGFTFEKTYGERASYKFSVDFLTTSWKNPAGTIDTPQEINSNPTPGTIIVAGTPVTLDEADLLSPQHVINKIVASGVTGWTATEAYESYTALLTSTVTGALPRPDVVLGTATNLLFVDKGYIQGSLIPADPLDDLKITGIFPIQVTLTYSDGSPSLEYSNGTDAEQEAGTLTYAPAPLTAGKVIINTPCTYLRVVSGGSTSVTINITRYTIPQGGGGSGGGDTYTNLTPTPVTLGGIPAGSTFLAKTMQQMWDSVLYPYQSPAFTSFAITGQANPIEVGDAILANRTFTWTTSNSGNITPNSISLRDVTASIVIASGLPNDGTETVVYGSVTKNTASSNTFRVSGTNTQSASFTRDVIISWQWRAFYGESALTLLTGADILTLRTSALKASSSGTYAMSTGGYKYWCFASSITQPTRIYDQATNLDIALAPTDTVSVTNAYGVVENYKVYRSLNVLGGSITAIIV